MQKKLVFLENAKTDIFGFCVFLEISFPIVNQNGSMWYSNDYMCSILELYIKIITPQTTSNSNFGILRQFQRITTQI